MEQCCPQVAFFWPIFGVGTFKPLCICSEKGSCSHSNFSTFHEVKVRSGQVDLSEMIEKDLPDEP